MTRIQKVVIGYPHHCIFEFEFQDEVCIGNFLGPWMHGWHQLGALTTSEDFVCKNELTEGHVKRVWKFHCRIRRTPDSYEAFPPFIDGPVDREKVNAKAASSAQPLSLRCETNPNRTACLAGIHDPRFSVLSVLIEEHKRRLMCYLLHPHSSPSKRDYTARAAALK
ncbi:uncharacterized protein FOMMEDRAFT_155973 [Fomitiporia mediterranea MF3/22]|uniref:uncharacterized protein n=1 Tax=Fomitiporia mediterranea (strain MF3/22) TaxID=694068 RepID=UPI00044085BE|nr:uncharacterized protein FOMMEDRAFT_155973 [Fomitiporia mediterranea MF3/22]EJD02648.1 hypothetical protein FOMMEDRAFT_155973 [Fomitiporia mediterranea MF3/22]